MSLTTGSLKDLVDHIFEIDSYSSKMGDDKNIVTLSFSVVSKEAATDLSGFLERGYSFILDSDVTPGEQQDGSYRVFVELERNKDVPEQIFEIMDGVGKLSERDDFKFRYYKSFRSHPLAIDKLEEFVPVDPDSYGIKMNESGLDNYKEFFDKSFIDSIEMEDDVLTLKKKWADPLVFEFVDFGDHNHVVSQINETIDIMNSFPEIMYLTKYLGDYNITKFGNKLVLENKNKVLILRRV